MLASSQVVSPGAPFRVLGLDPATATPETVRAQYRARARAAHPDAGGTQDAMAALAAAHAQIARPDLLALHQSAWRARTQPVLDRPDPEGHRLDVRMPTGVIHFGPATRGVLDRALDAHPRPRRLWPSRRATAIPARTVAMWTQMPDAQSHTLFVRVVPETGVPASRLIVARPFLRVADGALAYASARATTTEIVVPDPTSQEWPVLAALPAAFLPDGISAGWAVIGPEDP